VNNTVPFSNIKKYFPKKDWDVGYMTKTQLKICSQRPIKAHYQIFGSNFSNALHFRGIDNCIVLIRETYDTGNYVFYDEVTKILKNSPFHWFMIYTNFKEAAIQAGLGVRAKNSLIYSYRFGFESKICVVGFREKITELPTNKRINRNLWNRCVGCNDCIVNCPVKAIHYDDANATKNEKDSWIDGSACDNFIGFGDHPKIPSIKKFWHQKIHPELTKKEVAKLKTWFDVEEKYGKNGLPWDRNGYASNSSFGFAKDGQAVTVSHCRECTSQPRCSKWKGHYPYNKDEKRELIEKK